MSLVVLTAPAPLVDLDRFLEATRCGCSTSPLFLWDADGAPFGMAGRGEAFRIDARGDGRWRQLIGCAGQAFADMVDHRLPGAEDAPPPALVGGLAFHPMDQWDEPWSAFGDASFVMPRWLYLRGRERAFLRLGLRSADLPWIHGWLAGLSEILDDLAAGSPAGPSDALAEPDSAAEVVQMTEEVWAGLVSDALGRISARRLRKIVAARRSQVIAATPIDVLAVLARLRSSGGTGCVRFAFQRGAATFLGQTPEMLVSLSGLLDVATEAIAGSATGPDARAILERPKEQWEHSIVVEGIRRALEPLCERLDVPAQPEIRTLPRINHLCTPFRGALREPHHVLDLARRLHPTPAVSGAPGRPATRWIVEHEPVPRGWYAGPVGWFDPSGQGQLAVAIRSGVIVRRRAWLWAGAGIVAGSDPEAEYAETGAKQAPLLDALGLAA